MRLAKIYGKATALQAAWIDANRPSTSESARGADLAVDRSWSAVRSRLQDWVNVDDEQHGKRARELLELLFPTGLDFLSLPYAEQWSQSDRRLVLIQKDELETELGDLCDGRFVKRLQQAHAAYGEALQITKKKEDIEPTTRVIDAIRALRVELAGYARLILGLAEEDDDQAIAAAEAALEPILRYRKPRGPGEAAAEEETDEPVDAPLPDVPKGEGE